MPNFKRITTITGLLLILTSQAQAAFEPLPTSAPEPKDNISTPEKIALGKQLFFDPRLSVDGTVSCNSCHNVQYSGTDNLPSSVGVNGQIGSRSAPTVWNAVFLSSQMWDGSISTLEEQAKGPILNPIEMAMPHEEAAVERIAAIPGYLSQFQQVFGEENPVTYDNIAKAIAAYERTLITPNSRFDQFLRGDETALTRKEQHGMELFKEIGCIRCHRGPALAGPALPNGKTFYQWFPGYHSEYDKKYNLLDDLGFNNGKEDDLPLRKGKWRVPTLRNIAITAPYFHNGSVSELHEAVRVMAKAQLNKRPSEYEIDLLVTFLKTLTGEFSEQPTPDLPPDALTARQQ